MTEKNAETGKPSVVEAMAAVMGEVRAVAKGDRNTDQNYRFRGVDAVMNAVGPALRKHNVVVMPICEEANYRDVTTSRGKPSRECTVMVRFRFYGPAGDHIECVTPGESMDFGDKGAPKAMSVAYRIALLQALCLPTDEPEPDASTYERDVPPPREERQETGADVARRRLRETCTENGWDMERVAGLFAEVKKTPLREATDVASITKFREYLFTLPQADLQPAAAAAVNGTPA